MTRPRLCVCVVTYNQRVFIESCLRSILDQAVDADVRVVVGDDGSTDGTSDIIQALVIIFAVAGSSMLYLPKVKSFVANLFEGKSEKKADNVAVSKEAN